MSLTALGDYHGYHSPANVTFTSRIHYPGHLFPVAAWAVRYLRDLFPLNERVVLSGTWEHGFFAYAPVGAYNVGSIELDFEPVRPPCLFYPHLIYLLV